MIVYFFFSNSSMINISVSFGMEDVTEEMVKEYFRLGKS